jgi:hypothetical protein
MSEAVLAVRSPAPLVLSTLSCRSISFLARDSRLPNGASCGNASPNYFTAHVPQHVIGKCQTVVQTVDVSVHPIQSDRSRLFPGCGPPVQTNFLR